MEYIRKTYGVPAKRGGRVKYGQLDGTITGSSRGCLMVRIDGEKTTKRYHPTWNVTYL